MKCWMFSFSKNVYLVKASYFSIAVMLRAFEVQRFSTTRLHEIRLCISVFESPLSSSLYHNYTYKLKPSESISRQVGNNDLSFRKQNKFIIRKSKTSAWNCLLSKSGILTDGEKKHQSRNHTTGKPQFLPFWNPTSLQYSVLTADNVNEMPN